MDDCWYRRYSCVSCARCKALEFVKPGKPMCDTIYCGDFKSLRFKQNAQKALDKQRSQAHKKVEAQEETERKKSNELQP